jgi:putative FmdB family regulatory protein
MPIYEYRCPSCGGISEIWQGVGKRSDSLQCQHCGDSHLEKVLSVSHAQRRHLLRAGGALR